MSDRAMSDPNDLSGNVTTIRWTHAEEAALSRVQARMLIANPSRQYTRPDVIRELLKRADHTPATEDVVMREGIPQKGAR